MSASHFLRRLTHSQLQFDGLAGLRSCAGEDREARNQKEWTYLKRERSRTCSVLHQAFKGVTMRALKL